LELLRVYIEDTADAQTKREGAASKIPLTGLELLILTYVDTCHIRYILECETFFLPRLGKHDMIGQGEQ